jgi:hypothetical protein
MSAHSRFSWSRRGRCLALGLAASLLAQTAHAVPAYARQTGSECAACHLGALGPQLTPHGMKFKLEGYTEKNGTGRIIPLSAMLVAGATEVKDPQAAAAGNPLHDTHTGLESVAIFAAGRLTEHLGVYYQHTYEGGDIHTTHWDNLDLRYARTIELGAKEAIVGLSVNNNPAVQDVVNTLPAWRFPYVTGLRVAGPETALLLEGAGDVRFSSIGTSAYAFYNERVYAELGVYRALGSAFLDRANVHTETELAEPAPYWRIASLHDLHDHFFSYGLVGFNGKVARRGLGGPQNTYRDIGVDLAYQYLGTRKNIYAVNATLLHEDNQRALDGAVNSANVLSRADLHLSWYREQTLGVSFDLFHLAGTRDAGLLNGASPDTRGWVLQTDWTPFGKEDSWGEPFANVRLGLQYTHFDLFNGTGTGANDRSALFGFVWFAL